MTRWLYLITLGVAGALFVRGCLFDGTLVATGSMAPTLPVGQHIITNRLVYRFRAPRRGEIVVFPSPVDARKDLIKRVIAVAGDRVEIAKKRVFLNGRELDEPYVQHTRPDEMLKGDNLEERVVPRGHVFVLGDNRDQSGDSRDWVESKTGEHIYFVEVRKIKGKL